MTRCAADILAAQVASFSRIAGLAPEVDQAAAMVSAALAAGHTVHFCGNGGSAADAQHLAAEFLGRFLAERAALPAHALTTNSSTLTAIGNDYGFDEVFARQIRGLGRKGDVLVGLSTSGRSRNVIAAFEAAHRMGLSTIALTGATGGPLAQGADLAIRVPADETPRIQEMHIAVGHAICELVEAALA